jgi:hypothetical protein
MSRYRRLKIEGEAFFCTLAFAGRGSDLLVRFGECMRGHGAAHLCRRYAPTLTTEAGRLAPSRRELPLPRHRRKHGVVCSRCAVRCTIFVQGWGRNLSEAVAFVSSDI